MADRDEFDPKSAPKSDPKFEPKGDDHGVASPTPSDVTPESAAAKAGATSAKSGLPDIESPSISPAISEPVAIEEEAIEPKPEPEVEAADRVKLRALVPMTKTDFADEPPFEPLNVEDKPRRFAMKPRHWRNVRIAASVAIGAAFGAIVGAYATGGLAEKPQINVAAQEENKAMQQSLAKLAREVTTLKAHLDAANKRAQVQTASLERKLQEQINERLKKESADITGSISAPQTTAPAQVFADVPTPRPAPRVAMASIVPALTQPTHPPVIRTWSIRGASNGYVYVQGQFGDVYQVVPGAPLPGLGPVESIRRLDGRWVVKTPKGIIVSMRDRRYFE